MQSVNHRKQDMPALKFRYLRNEMIDLADGRHHAIPCRIIERSVGANGERILVPCFDLDRIHQTEIENEKPIIPIQEDGMSDALHSKLRDAAFAKALEAREKNEVIRHIVDSYVKSGTIEVVEDPFSRETYEDGSEPPARPYAR